MATASLSGLEGSCLPDLLLLVKQTAECARTRRVLDPSAPMVPDEVLEAKVLYAQARAWPLGKPQLRAEPQWRRPGDVEAAFFALYDALRTQITSSLDARTHENSMNCGDQTPGDSHAKYAADPFR